MTAPTILVPRSAARARALFDLTIPGRAIVLEGWGAFVLVPTDQRTTRLLIRLRGPGTPSLQSVALSPLGVLGFEPAHFIMERRMLLGIKDRAERGRSPTAS